MPAIETKRETVTIETTLAKTGVTHRAGKITVWFDVQDEEPVRDAHDARGRSFRPTWMRIILSDDSWNDGVYIGGPILKKDGTDGMQKGSVSWYHHHDRNHDMPDWVIAADKAVLDSVNL
jgi:hypothetical protein